MTQINLSRRAFLRTTAAAARGSAIVLSLPMIMTACHQADEARQSGAAFQTLSEEEGLEFSAIAARIIPTDGTPGATEAGAVYFMDTVLGDNREQELEQLREGLRELQLAAATSFGAAYFYELDENQQDQLLTENEQTPFFGTMVFLTIAGTFSLPEYGGNRDNIGYELIGFDDRHAWTPPFGFYDADFAERGQ